MPGVYNGPTAMMSSSAQQSIRVGTIQASGIGSNYGIPSVYGVYICDNGNMIDVSSTSNVTFSGSNSSGYEVYAKVLGNSDTVYKKVHLWIQFADVNQLGYFSIYQAEGNGEVTPVSSDYITFDDLLSEFQSVVTSNNLKNDSGGTLNSLSTSSVKTYLQTAYNTA
jgi:hypothetical protein